MRIKFINARILTLDNTFDILDGELVVKDNLIEYVGDKAPSGDYDQIIDCNKNLLMPGFKNAHTHSAMTFVRSYADDLPLHDWLFDKIFPMEEKLTSEDIYELSKLAIAEYVTSGITANFDMYMEPRSFAKASVDTGFRTVVLGCVNNFTESVQIMRENYEYLNNLSDLISYRLGFHAEYTTDENILIELSKLANELHEPVFTHSSETKDEVEGCKARHNGLTPTEYFEKLGLYNYGGGGYHLVEMSDHDIEIFKNRKLYAITCPGSNTKLASGIADIKKFLDNKIPVAIGTDGPASNNALDMFKEMYLVTGLQKIKHEDASCCDALDVLYMATVNGARAMGLENADVLRKGKFADIIMIDLHQPNMQPINNIAKNIVYSGSKQNVKMTMINGKILYENGNFYLGEDIEEIYRKANEITQKIKDKMN
ncbi:MAG: amidohydrolase [Erysipelotrichales bacterium]|nr:amidohydrolase [Erysipelotrichales bacterium]